MKINKKNNPGGFSTQIRKIYVKEDNTLNRFSLFLSALAIALIVLLLVNFKGYVLSNKVKASTLSNSTRIDEIYDYINSLDNSRDNFQESKAYMEEIKSILEEELKTTAATDATHYLEVNKLISEINSLLSSNTASDSNTRNELNNIISELRNYAENNNTNLTQQINKLTNTTSEGDRTITDKVGKLADEAHSDSEKIWTELQKLNNRTSDQEGLHEFDFGYKDGAYGYYIEGQSFKPF